jgi:hypothetical protein
MALLGARAECYRNSGQTPVAGWLQYRSSRGLFAYFLFWLGQADRIGRVPDIAIAFASRNRVPRTNAILLIQLEKYRIAGTEKTNGGPA